MNELEWHGARVTNWHRVRRITGTIFIIAAGLVVASFSGLMFALVVIGVRP